MTIILPENQIRPILSTTLDHLARFKFKVVVLITGHYPSEQVNMVHELAAQAGLRPGFVFLAHVERPVKHRDSNDPYQDISDAIAGHPISNAHHCIASTE
jgi:hypothetical protein